jgi:hypothetical protein
MTVAPYQEGNSLGPNSRSCDSRLRTFAIAECDRL